MVSALLLYCCHFNISTVAGQRPRILHYTQSMMKCEEYYTVFTGTPSPAWSRKRPDCTTIRTTSFFSSPDLSLTLCLPLSYYILPPCQSFSLSLSLPLSLFQTLFKSPPAKLHCHVTLTAHLSGILVTAQPYQNFNTTTTTSSRHHTQPQKNLYYNS